LRPRSEGEELCLGKIACGFDRDWEDLYVVHLEKLGLVQNDAHGWRLTGLGRVRCSMFTDPPPLFAGYQLAPHDISKVNGPPRVVVFPVYFDWREALEQARRGMEKRCIAREKQKAERETIAVGTRRVIDRSLAILRKSSHYRKNPMSES